MKKYEWDRTESNDIEMVESDEGIYFLWSDVEPLIEALKEHHKIWSENGLCLSECSSLCKALKGAGEG